MQYYAMLCYVMQCCATLCNTMLCAAMLWNAIQCYTRPCYAMLYYAMLYYTMPPNPPPEVESIQRATGRALILIETGRLLTVGQYSIKGVLKWWLWKMILIMLMAMRTTMLESQAGGRGGCMQYSTCNWPKHLPPPPPFHVHPHFPGNYNFDNLWSHQKSSVDSMIQIHDAQLTALALALQCIE